MNCTSRRVDHGQRVAHLLLGSFSNNSTYRLVTWSALFRASNLCVALADTAIIKIDHFLIVYKQLLRDLQIAETAH